MVQIRGDPLCDFRNGDSSKVQNIGKQIPTTNLSCSSVVVFKHTAQSFPTLDFTAVSADNRRRFDQLVVQSLMISFHMVVDKILADRSSQLGFSEEDHPLQTLGFY